MGSCSVALLYGKYSVCGAGYSGMTGGVKGGRDRVGEGVERGLERDRVREGVERRLERDRVREGVERRLEQREYE